MLTFASTLPGIFNNLVSSISRISHRQTMRRMYLQKDSHKMHIGTLEDGWTSNYRVCKTQANKCPLNPNTKQAPARTSKQTNKRGQAKHNFSHLRPSSPSFFLPSSFLHSIFILLLLCLPGCGSEAADSSSQTPQARALAGGWQLAASGPRGAAARSAGGERHGRCVLGEPRYSVCRHLISSGPVAVDRRPECR
jgi:hypothetical protein